MSDKQSILGRIAQLAKANIHVLLDQAEDPRKMADRLIRDYNSSIVKAEETAVAVMADLRLMEHDQREDVEAVGAWGAQALAASRKADELRASGQGEEADKFDGLARVALERQLEHEKEAKAAGPIIATQQEIVERLSSGLEEMRAKLSELRTRHDELVARATSVRTQGMLTDALQNIDVFDPAGELSRFEDVVRREEARAMGQPELAESSLDAQFARFTDFTTDAEIEARLAALKSGA
ncbi:hypothetical protein GCM10020367_41560 [Streptomyces sannanensis]|uniref:PspA/IM30 family protein n=1 Tax=Streptomyces sannanensis TaxID=285536 RepID=A0ABP6SEU6_9ACTN